MTTDNYSLMKMWLDMNEGDTYKQLGGSEIYKTLRAWYLGNRGEGTTINKLIKLGAIRKVPKTEFKELVLW